MAKYTMTLADYLSKGGQLPASFDLIGGFENHFIGRYCDKEIGFETDALFEIKLEAKANLVMQAYKDKIDARALYWTKTTNPTKVHYEKATTQYNFGEQSNQTAELPFNAPTAQPNVVSKSNEYKNNDERELRVEDNGETLDDVLKMLDFLNKDVETLVEKCLNEFDNLFMKVY